MNISEWIMQNVPLYALILAFILVIMGTISKMLHKNFKIYFVLAIYTLFIPVGICLILLLVELIGF